MSKSDSHASTKFKSTIHITTRIQHAGNMTQGLYRLGGGELLASAAHAAEVVEMQLRTLSACVEIRGLGFRFPGCASPGLSISP
jgi:uncharacterized Fe-S cluster-containing radical SAM superfamily protein